MGGGQPAARGPGNQLVFPFSCGVLPQGAGAQEAVTPKICGFVICISELYLSCSSGVSALHWAHVWRDVPMTRVFGSPFPPCFSELSAYHFVHLFPLPISRLISCMTA